MKDDDNVPERPRFEPEIIPPDRGRRDSDRQYSPWDANPFTASRGTQRVFVTRFGPFAIAMVMLALVVIVAIGVITIVGAVLIWVPVIAAVIVAGAALRLLRGFGRH